jgi:hypothetical protein
MRRGNSAQQLPVDGWQVRARKPPRGTKRQLV